MTRTYNFDVGEHTDLSVLYSPVDGAVLTGVITMPDGITYNEQDISGKVFFLEQKEIEYLKITLRELRDDKENGIVVHMRGKPEITGYEKEIPARFSLEGDCLILSLMDFDAAKKRTWESFECIKDFSIPNDYLSTKEQSFVVPVMCTIQRLCLVKASSANQAIEIAKKNANHLMLSGSAGSTEEMLDADIHTDPEEVEYLTRRYGSERLTKITA